MLIAISGSRLNVLIALTIIADCVCSLLIAHGMLPNFHAGGVILASEFWGFHMAVFLLSLSLSLLRGPSANFRIFFEARPKAVESKLHSDGLRFSHRARSVREKLDFCSEVRVLRGYGMPKKQNPRARGAKSGRASEVSSCGLGIGMPLAPLAPAQLCRRRPLRAVSGGLPQGVCMRVKPYRFYDCSGATCRH